MVGWDLKSNLFANLHPPSHQLHVTCAGGHHWELRGGGDPVHRARRPGPPQQEADPRGARGGGHQPLHQVQGDTVQCSGGD